MGRMNFRRWGFGWMWGKGFGGGCIGGMGDLGRG